MLVRDSSNKVRDSKESKKIGDQGERIVLKYLRNLDQGIKKDSIVWHADQGETPGYDLSYIDSDGEKICIEVKTTSGKSFINFIMTLNEVESAKLHGERYKIYLVAVAAATENNFVRGGSIPFFKCTFIRLLTCSIYIYF